MSDMQEMLGVTKLSNLSKETKLSEIIVFTDGACTGNGKKNARAGLGIFFPNKELGDVSEEYIDTLVTNQRAELSAIHKALNLIINNIPFKKIIVKTDSLYSIKSLTLWVKKWEKNDWMTANKKPVQNLDLIKPIYSIIKRCGNKIKFEHVPSHTGKKDFNSKGNEMADKLATSAIMK